MIFKKILRYLTVATLAIATVFLISSHKTVAEDKSKLLNSKAVKKLLNEAHLTSVLSRTFLTLVIILLRPIPTRVWK